ncbi:MAG: YecA family protein [Moraxellaceae bacterium]|nr:MAG: YecA family protein [Moraxellaceae bacterium]
MSLVESTEVSSEIESEVNAREFIINLLASPACPAYTMNIDQLDGYLHAVAAEPEATSPEAWIPLVFGGEFPSLIAGYSKLAITKALICLYNSHRKQVLSNQCLLSFSHDYSDDREQRIQAEQWARGFMQGYIFWQDTLARYLDENQTGSNQAVILPMSANDEIDDTLATISAVADANYALATGVTLNELRLLFNQLPQKVIEYGRIAHIIRSIGYAEVSETVDVH